MSSQASLTWANALLAAGSSKALYLCGDMGAQMWGPPGRVLEMLPLTLHPLLSHGADPESSAVPPEGGTYHATRFYHLLGVVLRGIVL